MRWLGGLAVLLFAGCVAAEAPAPAPPPQAVPPVIATPVPPPQAQPEIITMMGTTRDGLTVLTLNCAGAFTQGGVVLCRTLPGYSISVDGVASGSTDANGWAVIGFPRDHGPEAVVSVTGALSGPCTAPESGDRACPRLGELATRTYAIAPREFDIQRVDGLPQQTVTPTDPAVLARIQREAALKQTGFASLAPIEGFLDGFILPIEGGRVSGTWGNQRVLNGVPASPHFGYDIAAPTGTPIHAPAAGIVTLAQPDMHYEGGLVFIDHGQGLITMYLHMSRLDVAVGDHVTQGQIIGAVGSSGRATGPHLCWRMKWRDRQLDPSLALTGLAQARAQLN